MKLLLDTQIAVWALTDTKRLSLETKRLVGHDGNEIFVSAVSIWEIAIKFPLAKRMGAPPFSSSMALGAFHEAGYRLLDVTARHATQVETLPPIHGDPFDRMLVAQAIAEPLRFLTADGILLGYSELVILN